MVIKNVNPNNLSKDDVDRVVKRVKAIIVNSNDEILICSVNGNFAFVGGHIEENEKPLVALKREIKEETGIDIKNYSQKPVLMLNEFDNNYFNSGKSCLSTIYYYLVKTDKQIDMSALNLDEKESQSDFRLYYFPLAELKTVLFESESYERKKDLYKEMLDAVEVCMDKITNGPSFN